MTTNLPEHVRWWINSETLDFCFRVRPGDLEIVNKVTMFSDCDQVRLVGSYDYANGGGAHAVIIVHTDGYVYGIDMERSPASFLFNSTYEAFASTFDVLDEFLSVSAMLASNLGRCAYKPSLIPSPGECKRIGFLATFLVFLPERFASIAIPANLLHAANSAFSAKSAQATRFNSRC